MIVWINAYKAPNSEEILFSKGYGTLTAALRAREKKHFAMNGRWIGDPIKISFAKDDIMNVPGIDRIKELLKLDPLI